jgi:hypothetical protein
MKYFLLNLLPLLFLTACVSRGPQYQISIGNEHPEQSLRDVEVLGDGRRLQQFPTIGPNKSAALKPRTGTPPAELTVRWTAPDGSSREQTLAPRQDMPVNFEGMVFVKINPDQQSELQRIAFTSDDDSILPWNVPESWEGSVGFPGMTEE